MLHMGCLWMCHIQGSCSLLSQVGGVSPRVIHMVFGVYRAALGSVLPEANQRVSVPRVIPQQL